MYIILGTVLHIGAFAIAFINLPFNVTIGDTSNEAIIDSNPHLAIFASFLLGCGDAITRSGSCPSELQLKVNCFAERFWP